MREAFDSQHQTGRGRQWSNTRYRVSCGAERARLARLIISFRFSFRFGHSGFYNNPNLLVVDQTLFAGGGEKGLQGTRLIHKRLRV